MFERISGGKLSQIENLSPVAIEQLRVLATLVNAGFMQAQGAHAAQAQHARDISDIRLKLDTLLEERNSYKRLGERGADRAAELNSEIEPMERRLAVLVREKARIREGVEAMGVWLHPSSRLLIGLLDHMGVGDARDLFPELPTTSQQIF